jgi:hypothetical protein
MKIGHSIDNNGFLTGDILSDSEVQADVSTPCPDGFYKPKWNGSEWAEGLTQQEIDGIKNAPVTPSIEEQLKQVQLMMNTILMG